MTVCCRGVGGEYSLGRYCSSLFRSFVAVPAHVTSALFAAATLDDWNNAMASFVSSIKSSVMFLASLMAGFSA